MKNLYIFAIGGSGERVMSSLVMLLSAGVPINAENIIPVFVDNDETSYALKSCERLLDAYVNKEMGLHGIYEKSLGTDPSDWPSFGKAKIHEPLLLNVSGAAIGCLEKVISCPSVDKNMNKDEKKRINSILKERELLFTDDDMSMPLKVGFIGKPNIGSVVLKSISFKCPEFQNIIENISANDGVMVIGSLFGGTGAAGFPLIVNTFNGFNDDKIAAKKPILGGVAILPYFNVEASKSQDNIDNSKYSVESDTFDTKTRAALMYYDKYMGGMDCLYYVGDDAKETYPYSAGGTEQSNPVHRVELLSALSIIDFTKNGKHNKNIEYRQPVWQYVDGNVSISNIKCVLDRDVARALVRFQILEELFKNEKLLKTAIDQNLAFVHNIGFTEPVRKSVLGASDYEFAKGLSVLIEAWDRWLGDLSDSKAKRLFSLFKHEYNYDVDTIFNAFYSDNDFGVSKTETKSEGYFSRRQVTVAVPSELLDKMMSSFKALDNNKVTNVSGAGILATELLIVSKALDTVIPNNTNI